jgi:hypothetical protein
MRQRITGLFRSKIILTLMLAFLVLSLGGAAYGFKVNYVPGPVSATQRHGEPIQGYSSHADFERECKHCHAPVRCLAANLCQDCHRQIAQERAESEGLHGLLPGTDKCQSCHSEHQGRDAAISDIPLGSINHEQLAGFFLDLHHADYAGTPLTCQICHPAGQHETTSASCAECHAQEAPEYIAQHTELYGNYCVGCHDGQDRMIGFEHGQYYALDGAHLDAGCRDCHPGLTFTDTARDCADCHEDPEVHAGEFGRHCDRCHTAAGWSPAQLTEHIFRLDHGEQGEVVCETCHLDTYTVYTCYGCHDHLAGEMQEVHEREGIDELEPCGECHPTGIEGEAGEAGHGA